MQGSNEHLMPTTKLLDTVATQLRGTLAAALEVRDDEMVQSERVRDAK